MTSDKKMTKPLLKISNVCKSFNGVNALVDIDFELKSGQINCIVGENGAGKSTFIKILTGAYQPDGGTIEIEGEPHKRMVPRDSEALGIAAIYQENVLVGQLTVAENVFAANEKTNKWGVVSHKKAISAANELAENLKIKIDAGKKVEDLNVAEKQYVKILKALTQEPKILILDEPTAMLNISDANKVLALVKTISQRGVGIIYISHHLKEIVQIADIVTVFRDGKVISTHNNEQKNVKLEDITKDMIGRSLDVFYHKKSHKTDEVLLNVVDLEVEGYTEKNSFSVNRGEIVGIAGMVGSGRTEMVQALFGARKITSGHIEYMGKEVKINKPKDAIKLNIGYITEDRQGSGLALMLGVIENTTSAALGVTSGQLINLRKEKSAVSKVIEKVNIKCASAKQIVKTLSGGNQQKVIFGRWIHKGFDLILLDEPTKGVDINSKSEIYEMLELLTKEGKSILMISSDMPELISLCDRIAVMRKGKLVATLSGDEINENNIIVKALEVD